MPSCLLTRLLMLYAVDQFNFSINFLLRDSINSEMSKYRFINYL